MKPIKRYHPIGEDFGMEAGEDGDYVFYYEYSKLVETLNKVRAELRETKAELKKIKAHLDNA